MERAANLILVDGDLRRRAAVAHMLSPARIHVEPFETVEELAYHWPRSGVILLHDSDGAIIDLVARMAEGGNWFPLIAFSENPDPGRVVQATLEGALDYIEMPFALNSLEAAIARAQERAERMSHARHRETRARSRICKLTRREREVLDCVASGLSNRRIGEQLSISPRTVEIHRANMLGKLGARHTSEAIRIAIEADLVS